MPTIPPARALLSDNEPHRHRQMAESFGEDAERYDRTRPRYPDAMVDRIVTAGPGHDVLDVGTGTGIAARQFQAAGCTVLGIEPDARMADVELAEAFTAVYRRAMPDSLIARLGAAAPDSYSALCTKAADGIRQTGAFGEPEEWRFAWDRPYTRDEWLDQLPTFGGHSQFPPAALREIVAGVGAAIDAVGGGFTARYTAVVVTAARTGTA